MGDATSPESGALAPIAKSFKSWSDILSAILFLVGVMATAVTWFANTMTVPKHGYTFNDPDHHPADSTVFKQRTMLYEVRNPGPGTLTDLELVVRVADAYDEAKKEFTSGLRVGQIRTDAYSVSTNDGLREIVLRPMKIKGTPQLLSNQSFGVRLVSSDVNWQPKSIFVRHNGNQESFNSAMPEGESVVINPYYITLVVSILLIIAGVLLLIFTRITWKKMASWADAEADRRAQSLSVTEGTKLARALAQSEPPNAEELQKLEQQAATIIKQRKNKPAK